MTRPQTAEEKQLSTVPNDWDRSGLPAWTYYSEELNTVEKDALFRRHWQIACHVNDVPDPGSFMTFDMCGDRAIIMRGKDGVVRAFHNLCRHRGSRVVAEDKGVCKHVMTCPFHGWTYNLDGTLRSPAIPESLPKLDPVEHGLKPIEMEIWKGLVFIRFQTSDQPSVAEMMARHEDKLKDIDLENWVPADGTRSEHEMAVNWKSVRDVDNEGYHVSMAHPALQELYGGGYWDEPLQNGTSVSYGILNDHPGRTWSVRHYKKLLSAVPEIPEDQKKMWFYIGIFPNNVISFYPGMINYYQEFPVSARRTIQRSATYCAAPESQTMKQLIFLTGRIDDQTYEEDTQLIEWSCEATESSAYDGIILSDREYNVRSWHDGFRAKVPVLNLDNEPAPNTVSTVNKEMTASRDVAAE